MAVSLKIFFNIFASYCPRLMFTAPKGAVTCTLLKFHEMLWSMKRWAELATKEVFVQFFCFSSESWLTLCGPISRQMVFFLVLDILWFIVSVAGVVFTFFLWVLYHVFVSSSATEANCSMKDEDTCYCKREGERDVEFDSKCDHSVNMCLLIWVYWHCNRGDI